MGALIHYCIANSLQNKYDCDLFAICDVGKKTKEFFKNQKFVNFKDFWFYSDHVNLEKPPKPDLDYLKKFEEKYGLNLWYIAYTDRKFFKWNMSYKFKDNEILFIIEQECRFFEKILDEIKPDFFLIGTTDSHHTHLISELCRAKKIRVLHTVPSRFGIRYIINEQEDILDFKLTPKKESPKIDPKDFEEIQNYYKKFDSLKLANDLMGKAKAVPIWRKIKAYLQALSSIDSDDVEHFSRYGVTRWNQVNKVPMIVLRKRYLNFFINRNLTKDVDKTKPFIYFPLHSEPERTLLIAAPFYTNQLEVVTHLARSIPVGYKLYVKDHPVSPLKGYRKTSFYKEIMNHPNVVLLHPSVKREDVLPFCSLVATISGTAALEAALFGKPSIVFADTVFDMLPSVFRVKAIEELPQLLKTALKTKVNAEDVKEYVKYMDELSFEYNVVKVHHHFYNRIFYKGTRSVEKEITDEKMKSYLEENSDVFNRMADNYIKKFKELKKIKI